MNRRVVGTAGIPAGVLRADCHAGKDAGGPRFMGSFVFHSDLLTGHEPSRTRDEDEDEDEKRGQLPPVPHSASRTPHSEGSWEGGTSTIWT